MRRLAALVIALFVAAACGGGGTSGSRTSEPAAIPGSPAPVDASSFEALASGWRTDFTRASVSGGEFLSGGPGKDGIPAIDHPKFVPVADATFVDDREPVLALEINGDARAYPVQILIWHELANDVVGGTPVAVSYCPLCNSSVVFNRMDLYAGSQRYGRWLQSRGGVGLTADEKVELARFMAERFEGSAAIFKKLDPFGASENLDVLLLKCPLDGEAYATIPYAE